MELEELANRSFLLDAVDDLVSAKDYANGIRFRLDGVVYEVLEDEEDGYRSSAKPLTAVHTKPRNVFPPVRVVSRLGAGDQSDILYLDDEFNSNVVLEVGTDNSDDYYPSFVASFHPQNMVTNQRLSTYYSEVNAKISGVRGLRRKIMTGGD